MISLINNKDLPVLLLIFIPGVLFGMQSVEAASLLGSSPEVDLLVRENPEYMLHMINRLREAYNDLLEEDESNYSKRGLDLGLGRGFSGSQAAKQRMGMASATFAGGPGRRRRNGNGIEA